jgi:hypothetical protein
LTFFSCLSFSTHIILTPFSFCSPPISPLSDQPCPGVL